jgi:DNA-binding MarR family transcriptional regulator
MADPADVLDRLGDIRVSEHLLSKLKYAQNTARAALAAEMEKIGLTTPQFLALAAIEETAEISSADLARCSFVTAQAMVAIVARLQSSGLITRAPAPRGGRALVLRLTEKGSEKLRQARMHAYALERYIYELLGGAAYGTLLRALDRITEALSQATTLTKTTPWDTYVEATPLPEPPQPTRKPVRKRRSS